MSVIQVSHFLINLDCIPKPRQFNEITHDTYLQKSNQIISTLNQPCTSNNWKIMLFKLLPGKRWRECFVQMP